MNTARAKVRVWDPLVRVFHWGLVAAFATAWLTADEVQPVHEVAGYTVAGLVAFRLVWGLVGSRYARFAQFVKGPGATLAYLGHDPRIASGATSATTRRGRR
jgi:cytochrome b